MVDRIKQIIFQEGLTSGSFADQIGVQRSSMSHIINGRNNPSLDFMVKTLQAFPAINPEWLLTGSGPMYRDGIPEKPVSGIREPSIFDPVPRPVEKPILPVTPKSSDIQIDKPRNQDKFVDKVLIFYSDQTYDEFSRTQKP